MKLYKVKLNDAERVQWYTEYSDTIGYTIGYEYANVET